MSLLVGVRGIATLRVVTREGETRSIPPLGRGGENRTPATSTPCSRTTTIRHPVQGAGRTTGIPACRQAGDTPKLYQCIIA